MEYIFYTVCCNRLCSESGSIKQKHHKCHKCKKHMKQLSLSLLNENYCHKGNNCYDEKCCLIHPKKNHQSPPFISPCHNGDLCFNTHCVFLHPECGAWLVRV